MCSVHSQSLALLAYRDMKGSALALALFCYGAPIDGLGGAVIMPPKDNSDAEKVRRRLTLVREWKGMNQAEFCQNI